MRYRLMASYQGSPFEAGVGPGDSDIVLFAACPPPEELGFEPATGHWRRQLRLQDVQAVWESRPVGIFRGERCIVLDDLGDRLHIGYLGHDGYRAAQLGYWQVDRGVFELVAARTEVSEIVEERTEYPRRPGSVDRDGPAGRPASAGQLPPGAPQDQAMYLPPALPQDQASYLPGAAEYFPAAGQDRYPPDSTAGYGWEAASDHGGGVALPLQAEPPLPLEAAALRAASESRRPRQTAAQRRGTPAASASAADLPRAPGLAGPAAASAVSGARPTGSGGQRRSARRRLATERLFAELATLAAIPVNSYAVGEEVEGALCLLQTEDGFEVFHSAAGKRHELQTFATEEAACFYLFGVLAADAVRNGSLRPAGEQLLTSTGPLPIVRTGG